VGGTPLLTTYTVPLTGAYTTEDAGLEIIDSGAEYGPQATGAVGATRQFTIDNLTSKSLTLSIALPRQFVLSGAPCSGLAPNASCNFSVAFLPLANGDITGTLFAEGTPTDGSATLDGIGYVEGYGVGTGALSIAGGGLLPGGVLGFGQVPSGGVAKQTLTLTNSSTTQPLTVRRITSEWPFLATSTCGATLTAGGSCAVTLSYTPINQVATGTESPPSLTDSGTLVIESDAISSPDLIDLTGSSTPATVGSPSNTAPQAAFVATPSSLTFATTTAGDISAPQSVTLDNTGTATVSILGLQTSADFSVTSDCSTIVPGASCALTVTFTPQNSVQLGASKTRISAVEISSNASTPLEFISLIGVASAPTLVLAQTSLDFGTLPVGTSFTQSFTGYQCERKPDDLQRHYGNGRLQRSERLMPGAWAGAGGGDELYAADHVHADAGGCAHGDAVDCDIGDDASADGDADGRGRAVASADHACGPELWADRGGRAGEPLADAGEHRYGGDHRA
jgi:hypothetical protein